MSFLFKSIFIILFLNNFILSSASIPSSLFLQFKKYLYKSILSCWALLRVNFDNKLFLLLVFFIVFNLSNNSGPFLWIFIFLISSNKSFNFGYSFFGRDFHLFKYFFNKLFFWLLSWFLNIAFNSKPFAIFWESFKLWISSFIFSTVFIFRHLSKYFCNKLDWLLFIFLLYKEYINLAFRAFKAFSYSAKFFHLLNAFLKLLLSPNFFFLISFLRYLLINLGFRVLSNLSKNSLPYLFT